jgi:hypothetical protein
VADISLRASLTDPFYYSLVDEPTGGVQLADLSGTL